MPIQSIDLGQVANDGTGDPLRDAFDKINDNFGELYGLISSTITTATYPGATSAISVQAAINVAQAGGFARVNVAGQHQPYDPTGITFYNAVQMVREGGNWASWDIIAYGATPNTWPTAPSADSSVAIQAAINTGHGVDFVGQFVKASNLTQTQDEQILYSSTGIAHIVKGANGPILASTGDGCQTWNLAFRGGVSGADFTGDNVTFAGENCSMLNSGSRYAAGRAVKATGGHFVIDGTCDVYQTVDGTATGYDIELGIAGTVTLYHKITSLYTSQATGGILFVDCGGQVVAGGLFGKLTISNPGGTPLFGMNGGEYSGNRILGNVTANVSGAIFNGNPFGSVAIVFGVGTSGHTMDASNTFQAGCTVTNNGNGAILIVRSVGTSGDIELKYGDDTSVALLTIKPSDGRFIFPEDVVLQNNTGVLRFKTAAGGDGFSMNQSTGNSFFGTNPTSNEAIFWSTTGASSYHSFNVNGAETCKVDASSLNLASGKVLKVNAVQVVGAQGAAVIDATDAASAITQLNALLARCRAHGLIA